MNVFTKLGGFLGIVAAGMIAQPSVALASQYTCNLDASNSRGWIAERMVFDVVSNQQAIVQDYIVEDYIGGPMQASFRRARNGNLQITWAINGQSSYGHRVRMRYRAAIKPDNSIRVRISPVEFQKNFFGRGQCELR